MASNDICVFEVDHSSTGNKKIKLSGITGTSAQFEIAVLIKDGFSNTYENKGTFDSEDSLTVTFKAGTENLLIVAKPKSTGNSFYFKAAYQKPWSFEFPFWGYFVLPWAFTFCIIFSVVCLTTCSAKLKANSVKRANEARRNALSNPLPRPATPPSPPAPVPEASPAPTAVQWNNPATVPTETQIVQPQIVMPEQPMYYYDPNAPQMGVPAEGGQQFVYMVDPSAPLPNQTPSAPNKEG